MGLRMLELTGSAEGEKVPHGKLQSAYFWLLQADFTQHGLHGGGVLQIALPLLHSWYGPRYPRGQKGLQPLRRRAEIGHKPVQMPGEVRKHLHQLQLVGLRDRQSGNFPGQSSKFSCVSSSQVQANSIDATDPKGTFLQKPSIFQETDRLLHAAATEIQGAVDHAASQAG